MKGFNVYRVEVSSAPLVPNPKFTISSFLVVAKNEKDAKDNFDPAITGICGSIKEVLKVECLGIIDYFVDEIYKESWNRKNRNNIRSISDEEDDGA